MAKKGQLKTYRAKRDFARTPEPAGGEGVSAVKKRSTKVSVKGGSQTAPTKRKAVSKKAVKKAVKAVKDVSRPEAAGRVFVVQKHDASHLHYDFRLEIAGVLKSWAVPKGPSMNPSDKRLAVETEDHPLEYASFEGIIPEGEYGAGTVIVWDTGQYYNLKLYEDGSEVPMEKTYDEGRIEIWMEGEKLRGGFALVLTRLAGRQKQWMLIKMRDKLAHDKGNITEEQPQSVKSGKRIEQL
jgi:DNA ligase D-like protein (predicted 3'-phosphoesterase)